MDEYRFLYLSVWITFFALSLVIVVKKLNSFKIEALKYWHYLTTLWKIITFTFAGTFISFAGPFTNDPTWDFVSGFGMSLLTYLTAPWAVGVIFQFIKKRHPLNEVIVAVTFWLVSSS